MLRPFILLSILLGVSLAGPYYGVNVVYKESPWHPDVETNDLTNSRSFSDIDLKYLSLNGYNLIRLGIMFPGVKPSHDYVNVTYLETMGKIVKMAGNYNISVLLDFHQDVFSEQFCGEGFPSWVYSPPQKFTFPAPIFPTFIPNKENCAKHAWASYQLSLDVNRAYQYVYDNPTPLLEFWDIISSYFSKYSNVIGYEIMNEPWPGNVYKNPLILDPYYENHHQLVRFYKKIVDTIRKNDNRTTIYFEPVTWENYAWFNFPQSFLSYDSNLALSYHCYVPPHPSIRSCFTAKKNIHIPTLLTEFEDMRVLNYLGHDDGFLYWSYKNFANVTGDSMGFFDKNGKERKTTKILNDFIQHQKIMLYLVN